MDTSARPSPVNSPEIWPTRLKDVSEIDVVEEQLAMADHIDEADRRLAIERAASIDETARQRGMGT